MHHFIRYDIKTGEVLGEFTTMSTDFLPTPFPDEAYVELPEHERSKLGRPSPPTLTRLRGRIVEGKVQRLTREPIFAASIELSTDLKDIDGDGILDAPADGETEIVVWAQLMSGGKVAKDRTGRVRFRTTRGTLSQRDVEIEGGVAEVHMKAITETIQAVVSASAEGCQPASLTIEFVPVAEFQQGDSSASTEKKPTRARATKGKSE